MKITSAAVLVALAGVAFARPSPQASGLALPACVTTCINQVVGTGTCTSATDVTCLCSNAALKSCVQQGCPPSFVDTLGQYCGTGPFSSSSASASSEPFTIQTNTLSGATATATTSAASSAAVTTSAAQSSHAATTGAAATTAPAGNAGDLTVSVQGLTGILAVGLGFVAGALLI